MKMASLDLKETWASRVTGGRSAHLVPGVKMALKVQRAVEVPMVTQAPWGPQGRRGNWEFRDCPGTQEDKARRVPLDSRDSLAPTERRAAGGHLESLDHGDSGVQRAQGVKEARGASQGSLGPRATLEAMARPALPVSGDPTDPKDPLASLDRRVPRAPQARTGSLDTPDREARPASKARLAPRGPQAWSALRVPREKQVQWASVATLGPPALLVNRASQALLAKKGRRVTQAQPASLGRTALQAYAASLGTEGSLVRWEPLG